MISIRTARPDDLPRLLSIYNHVVTTSTASFDLEEQTLEQRTAWFSHYGGAYPLLVAELDGQVAGYCSLSAFRSKPGYAKTVESSVYLDERFQGQGIGLALMQAILQQAADLGHHVVIAGIAGGNEASVKLHRKLGFELVGSFREVGYKFGAWQDVQFYQLFLP